MWIFIDCNCTSWINYRVFISRTFPLRTLVSCQCVSLAAIWALLAYLILWAVATPTTYGWTYTVSFVVVSLVAFAVSCCRCRRYLCCCRWGTSRASGFDRRTALQVWVELKAKSTFTQGDSSALKCRKFGASGMWCVLQLQQLQLLLLLLLLQGRALNPSWTFAKPRQARPGTEAGRRRVRARAAPVGCHHLLTQML